MGRAAGTASWGGRAGGRRQAARDLAGGQPQDSGCWPPRQPRPLLATYTDWLCAQRCLSGEKGEGNFPLVRRED